MRSTDSNRFANDARIGATAGDADARAACHVATAIRRGADACGKSRGTAKLISSFWLLSLTACQTVMTGTAVPKPAAASAATASPLQRVVTPEIERRTRAEARQSEQPTPAQAVAEYRRRHTERTRTVGAHDATRPAPVPVADTRTVPSNGTTTGVQRTTVAAAAPSTATLSTATLSTAMPSTGTVSTSTPATTAPSSMSPSAAPVDLAALERSGSGYAGIFGSMAGLVRHCAARQVASSNAPSVFQSAFEARDGAGQSQVPPAARQAFDSHAASIATTGTIDCGYVRGSTQAWSSLANDVRSLSRESAEQYRKGLVYELRRATGQ